MHLNHLQVQGFRNLQAQKIEFQPGLNFFYGDNGAGKTSLLEAVHVLATGKSFRSGSTRNWVQQEADRFVLHLGWQDQAGRTHSAGVQWQQGEWQRRLDHASVAHHVDIARMLPCMVLHPGTQQLVSAGPEVRRKLLNWMMFHVEPAFLSLWRNFQHARAQRNALLRQKRTGWDLQEWTRQYLQAAEQLHHMQLRMFEVWNRHCLERMQAHPQLQAVVLRFHPGWAQGESLQEALERNMERDMDMGHTQAGPHRMDIRFRCQQADAREWLSRGQQKLLAYTLVLSATECVAKGREEWPLLLLDDLQAELDQENLLWLVEPLHRTGSSILANGLQAEWMARQWKEASMFHVEHGEVQPC